MNIKIKSFTRFFACAALLPIATGLLAQTSFRSVHFPGKVVQISAGFTARDSVTGTSSGTNNLAFDDHIYLACNFTAGGSYTITKAILPMLKVAAPTFGLICSIYSDNAGVPGTLIGTASASVNASTLGTSEADVIFTGMSAALTSGVQYWIVVSAPSAPMDFTNYVVWASIAGVGSFNSYNALSPGTSWAAYQSFTQLKMKLYSTP